MARYTILWLVEVDRQSPMSGSGKAGSQVQGESGLCTLKQIANEEKANRQVLEPEMGPHRQGKLLRTDFMPTWRSCY